MFTKFLTFLKYEEQLLGEILRLSERQQNAIIKHNIKELEEINSYQNELNKNLFKAEQERMQILANWLNINSYNVKEIKLTDLKKFISKEEYKELVKVQNNFKQLTDKIYNLNNTNKILINKAKQSIKEMIEFLTNGTQNVCNYKVWFLVMEQFMSVNNSIIIDATSKALKIQSEVLKIAKELNLNEMYQIKSRLISTVNNLSANVEDAFSLKNRLDRIRNFVLITGRMLECRDYLQLINKLHINDTVEVINDIDELTNLLMVNSGSIN